MIYLKNEQQIAKMRSAGSLLFDIISNIKENIKPGITTYDLDKFAREQIKKNNAVSSFLGYRGYPAVICASPNEVVIHGIPSKKTRLQSGDILSIDCAIALDGWVADSAFTVGIGDISEEAKMLIADTEKSFFIGARKAIAGNKVRDIGQAIQEFAEGKGYGVIRDFTGHGVGQNMHEDPDVPNFYSTRSGPKLRKGMTLAVEPMIALGTYEVSILEDDWTVVTDDNRLSAHYEHTIAINENGFPEVLTLPGYVFSEDK